MPTIARTAEQAQYATTMGLAPDGTEPEQIILDGVPIPVTSMNYSDLSRFESKLTIGDYSKDSDALLSTWAQSGWNGGVLIDEHIEGGTDQRARWSTLWTRSPGQLTLNARAKGYSADDTTHYPVGDYDGQFWFAVGTSLQTMDDPGTTYTLSGTPVAVGVEYAGELVIPLGELGIDIFDGATIANDPDVPAISLLIWDDKLFALTVAGDLIKWDGTTWTTPAVARSIPSREIPRSLTSFYDRSGTLTPTVITNRGVWMLDLEADVLHKTRLDVPPGTDNGLGVTQWRDDGLYYPAGLGVYRHSASGVITTMGLDRDDGVPMEYRGRITSMVAEHNSIIALLEGDTVELDTPETPDEFDMEHSPLADDLSFDAASSPSISALMLWNEAGWHVLHAFRTPVEPNWLYLSLTEMDGWDYTLVCGHGTGLTFIPLSKFMFGPRQLVQSQVQEFEPDGVHLTGRFDAGMVGFRKLASHFEVNMRDPTRGTNMATIPFEGSVTVEYMTDVCPTWQMLGTVEGYGRTVLPFNVVDQFVRGTVFTWIEFRYTMERGANTRLTPIIDSTVLKYIKLPLEGRTWTCTVDLEFETYGAYGPEQLSDFITRLTMATTFTKMQHLGNTYRVRVSQVNGAEATVFDGRKALTLSIVAVPIPGYEAAA